MATLCRAHTDEEDARATVERLLAAGVPGGDVQVLMGEPARDGRDAPHGTYAGAPARAVGSFAGRTPSPHDGMGAFAGEAAHQREGGFADADRDTVTSFGADGVRRLHVASHRELGRLLRAAGLDAAAAEQDVSALHEGRVLVLVRTEALDASELAAAAG